MFFPHCHFGRSSEYLRAHNLLIGEVFVEEDNLEVQIGNLQKPKENSLPGTQNVIIWLKSQLQFLTSSGGWQLSKIYVFELERPTLWYNFLPLHNRLMSHDQPHMGVCVYIYVCIYKNTIAKDTMYVVRLEILLSLRKYLFLSEQAAVLTKT